MNSKRAAGHQQDRRPGSGQARNPGGGVPGLFVPVEPYVRQLAEAEPYVP
ncbi:hypothetical protein ACFS5L_33545 [Streptomyces phyllanthi]|nr:hypothetical protein [Streptomyces phyllanthi]